MYRWVQHYAPELKKRPIDEQGNTLDFYLSHRRNAKAAKCFLKKLIKSNATCDISVINTDTNPAYATIKGFEMMRMF